MNHDERLKLAKEYYAEHQRDCDLCRTGRGGAFAMLRHHDEQKESACIRADYPTALTRDI